MTQRAESMVPDVSRLPARGVMARLRSPGWLLAAILALGLVIRLVILLGTGDLNARIADEQHYQRLAVSLVEGNGYAFEPGRPTSMRPPLYPALLALIWSITGTDNLQAVRLVQIFLSLLNAWLLYRLGVKLFDRRAALIATAMFTLYPSLIFYNSLLLTETVFTLLLTLLALGYCHLLTSGKASTAFLVGFVLGLGALTRSVLWPLPLFLCSATLLAVRGPMLLRARAALLILVGFLLVVAPWSIRNTALQGRLTIVDTMGGINLLCGNYAHTPHDRPWDAISLTGEHSWVHQFRLDNPGVSGWTEGEKEGWAQKRALAFMKANFGLTAWRGVLKFADFWALEREFIAGIARGLYQVPRWWGIPALLSMPAAYIVLMLLAGLGVFLARPDDRRCHWFLLLLVLFVCGIHTVVFGHPRYRVPLTPFFILYAAAAIHGRSWRQLSSNRPGMVGFVLTLLVLGLTWARDLLFRDADRIRELIEMFL